jgi:hypothetical protein
MSPDKPTPATKVRFGKPAEWAIAAGKRDIVKFAGEIVARQSVPLKVLREQVVEGDTTTLNWVDTVAALRALRKVDEDVAEGEIHLLGAAIVSGAPVARACRDVWISPAAFKARADVTGARVLLVEVAAPDGGA